MRYETVLQAVMKAAVGNNTIQDRHTLQINRPTRCNNFSSLLLDVYLQLNMFRASSRPS